MDLSKNSLEDSDQGSGLNPLSLPLARPVTSLSSPSSSATSTAESGKEEQSPQVTPAKSVSFCEKPILMTSNSSKVPRWWNKLGEAAHSAELRSIFMNEYKVGSFADSIVGGAKERYLQIDQPLTLALFGPPGSGKSSIINTFTRILEDEKEYLPVAGVNDEEPGRTVRTRATQSFLLGRERDSALGKIECWDLRGNWHVGQPEMDVELCRRLLFGVNGVGENCSLDSVKMVDLLGPDIVPVGGCNRRAVNLIVFVINANSDDLEFSHLNKVLNIMNMNEYPYAILLTKCDLKFGDSWVTEVPRKKFPGIPENDTHFLENYTAKKSRRDEHIDRNALMVLFKLLLAAERSLLRKPRLPAVVHRAVRTASSGPFLIALVLAFALINAVYFIFNSSTVTELARRA